MALGTGSGSLDNGVYWSQDPQSNNPIWYVGDPGGTDQIPAVPPTTVDARNGEFPVGNFAPRCPGNLPFPLYGDIKISAVAGTIFNNTTVFASVAAPSVLYAGSTVPINTLFGVYTSANGGQLWAQTTVQPPNYLQTNGNYANAIVAASATTVFVGGSASSPTNFSGEFYETTNGGASWGDVSVEANVSPATTAFTRRS